MQKRRWQLVFLRLRRGRCLPRQLSLTLGREAAIWIYSLLRMTLRKLESVFHKIPQSVAILTQKQILRLTRTLVLPAGEGVAAQPAAEDAQVTWSCVAMEARP
ncbi:hypothetical protein CHARACLAT_021685 [Characodon lateralis]|uniref:Uncharacterized protein n=1 Tax=Characodon lateralis TaxID=208331 RepID=A0ABU7E5B9_9TELE|nr:hypothetical protein [Characodon lateralis]